MNAKPLRDFILVSKDKEPEKTPGGLIYRPESVEEKIVTGVVLAAGSGRVSMDGTVVPLEVKLNDKVVFNKNMATEFKVDGETVYLLREDQVMCVLS